MNKKDILHDWFKELTPDNAPDGFSVKVMHRVMDLWAMNPHKYQPIISKKTWWNIGIIALVITMLLFSVHSIVPVNPYSSGYSQSFFGINISHIFTLMGTCFTKLNNISPAVGIGMLAILALWFFDLLFTKLVQR